MKYDKFRRSRNVEDYTDPLKPVDNKIVPQDTLREMGERTESQLAEELGRDDVGTPGK